MEIRPILSAMLRNKVGGLLVALQIAITLAVIVNALFIINQRIEKMSRPTGIDVDNIIVVTNTGFAADYNHEYTVGQDLDYLNALPGVVSASTAISIPLGNSGSSTSVSLDPEDHDGSVEANGILGDPRSIETLGVNLIAGRTFTEGDMSYSNHRLGYGSSAIVTADLAEKLFPDENALGKVVFAMGGEQTIVGIVERMKSAFVDLIEDGNVIMISSRYSGPHMRYLIRAEPGRRDELIPQIESELAARDKTRIIRSVRPLTEVVASSFARDKSMTVLLSIIIGLLIIITSLGIVGLASFSVRQRTKQIGTRRAIGARRVHILRYFLVENWMLTTTGVVIGTVATIGLNMWLVDNYSLPKLDVLYIPVGIVALWLLGLLAVLAPAMRAAAVAPAIATRNV